MHWIPFSYESRQKRIDYLAHTPFDLLIIGGGITGAGIAREAALSGLRVALIEAKDFGSGTSSRSTKLFHGGLRYLEHAEFLLVREGGREREGMQRLAPHLVEPLPFLLPIYRSMKYGKFAMGTAVWLYDRLAQVSADEQRVILSREEVLQAEPGLNEEDLTGGIRYHEYLTDDARCVVTVIRAAELLGACALNYARCIGLLVDEESGLIRGARVSVEEGGTFEVRARVVVNAAGPWIESVLAMEEDDTSLRTGPRILHSRGVHLVFPRKRLPITHAFAIQTPDGRLMFIIPRQDVTFVGTTDEAYEGELYQPGIHERDVAYLLDLLHGLFPNANIVEQDIIGQWSGVRPLVLEPGKETKDVSRKDQISIGSRHLVTIAGGKLTAWRKMAEEVMEHVYEVMERQGHPVNPYHRERASHLSPISPLPGSLQIPPKGVAAWSQRESERMVERYGIAREDAFWLTRRYGDEAESVLLCAERTDGLARVQNDVPLLKGELDYLIEAELVCHLSDLVVRRTGLGYFGGDAAMRALPEIAGAMAKRLGWDDARVNEEIAACTVQAYWEERDLRAQRIKGHVQSITG
ncbi:glycerol-3-phosphate dehydrogenase/oxidase [Ferroacidibacillus organovorans]|uniref:Aerobic glycerol-3-phosphate dehydrogenase n=1 Tax=Ferroacidibacillus organovorans TaxID=1765683 RepID=A0A101XNU7_9BACL|nr:glycerol-3-phosphate dehydrogenase/oxidase [Ferroacidibacillus organovorans]KUO94810.1 hypothetical protein ATW55_10385 [Ferroacidibacillus organovorans]